jgi:hypothetical protein
MRLNKELRKTWSMKRTRTSVYVFSSENNQIELSCNEEIPEGNFYFPINENYQVIQNLFILEHNKIN